MCRTYGAWDCDDFDSQPFRARLTSGAPPALAPGAEAPLNLSCQFVGLRPHASTGKFPQSKRGRAQTVAATALPWGVRVLARRNRRQFCFSDGRGIEDNGCRRNRFTAEGAGSSVCAREDSWRTSTHYSGTTAA